MVDCIVILTLVVLNGVIGFYQEFKAEKSIAALKKLTAPHATVRRNGQVTSIPASEIVAGDILELEAGDLIAADARLLEAAALKCIESALTGESEGVTKRAITMEQGDIPLGDRENMVFMGTSVTAGTALGVVVATGMNTELGHIAGLIEEVGGEESTPLQKKLDSFGRVLVWAALGIVALLFGLGLLRGVRPFELFMTSVSLAVAAVPEGLPAVVTVALALGVLRMSRRRALVRNLPAAETLGSTTVICTDKTGTLTVGEMTVRSLYVAGQSYEVTGEGYGPGGEVRFEGKKAGEQHSEPLLELATILLGCNNAHLVQENKIWKVVGDPTEGALLAAGPKAGGNLEHLENDLPKQYEIPFDSDRKRSSVIRRMPDGKLRAFTNGAPGVLLQLCTRLYTRTGIRPLADQDRQCILAQTTSMAQQALRVLASAYRELGNALPADLTATAVEQDLVFVGLTGMYDPPRPEAKPAVAECHDAGIRVVMITGDHPATAMAIAREIGIASAGDAAVAGVELDKMTDGDLRKRVPQITVYARVTAEHKLRIIRAWKANNAVVAMTGDGVNDAPAIKGADIGIAMGESGTEVTRQASDIIITDDNFASIVAAVEEGRGIYDNIRKTLQYLLAGNTGELLLMTVCVAAGFPSPLLPIHLLWINLVTDGLPALCLATDPIDPDVMKRHPRPRSDRITDRGFLRTMFLTGFLTAGVAFAVYPISCGAGNNGNCPHLCFRRSGICRTLALFRSPERNQADLANPPLHEPESGHRSDHFFRTPDMEPTQRDSGPLPENLLLAIHRLPLAARRGDHPVAGARVGEAEAEQEAPPCVCRPSGRSSRPPLATRTLDRNQTTQSQGLLARRQIQLLPPELVEQGRENDKPSQPTSKPRSACREDRRVHRRSWLSAKVGLCDVLQHHALGIEE